MLLLCVAGWLVGGFGLVGALVLLRVNRLLLREFVVGFTFDGGLACAFICVVALIWGGFAL